MGSGFNVKTKINSAKKIIKDHGLSDDGAVTRFMRDDADRLMNRYIPFKSGSGRRNKTYPNNHSIKYTNPYMHYIYGGKLYLTKNGSSYAKLGEKKVATGKSLKYHTSGTGPKWDRLMLQCRKKDLLNDVQNFIKKGGK